MVNGRMIGTFPNEHCLRSPDLDHCATYKDECPDGFIISNSVNWTGSRCLPSSYEDAKQSTRERRVLDPNRCPADYLLDVDLRFDDGSGEYRKMYFTDRRGQLYTSIEWKQM